MSISPQEALMEVKKIKSLPGQFSTLVTLLSFPLISVSIAIILSGGWSEAALSFFLGLVVGGLNYAKNLFTPLSEIFEFLSAFAVTIISTLISNYAFGFDFQVVLISSLIVIVPGLNLTIAMNELATNHLASGTARLMGTIMIFFKIAFGILLAMECAKLFLQPISPIKPVALNSYIKVLAVILSCLGLTIAFMAKKSDFKWVLLSGFVTIFSLKLGTNYLSAPLSIFLSAFTCGIFSNLIAKLRNKPAAITLLPGIIFIVPGSIGLKGLNMMFQNNLIAGIEFSVNAIIISVTIIAGLFFANIFLPPRKGL